MKKFLTIIFGVLFSIPAFATLPQAAINAGYTEVEYIESTGTQYIDTGVVGTINTDIEIKGADFTEASAQLVVTTTTGNGSQLRIAKFGATQKVGAGIGTGAATYSTSDGVSQFVAKLENHNLYLDGQLVGAVSTDGFNQDDMGHMLILAGQYGKSIYYGVGKVYYVKIWDNGTLVRDFVPVKKTVNGTDVYGMYNVLDSNPSTAFYGNAGTGTFTGGNPVATNCENLFDMSQTPTSEQVNSGVWVRYRVSIDTGPGTWTARHATLTPGTYTITDSSGSTMTYYIYDGTSATKKTDRTFTLTIPSEVWRFWATSTAAASASEIIIKPESCGTCTGTLQTYTSATGTVSQSPAPTPSAPVTPTFYTQGNMVLRKINATYYDSYDASTGKITRRVGVRVLTGSESWILSGPYSGTYPTFFLVDNNLDNASVTSGAAAIVFSNYFSAAPVSGANSDIQADNTVSVGSTAHTNHTIWIRTSDFATVADFKSWLAEQYANGTPVTIYYPLATATTEDWTETSYCLSPIKIATTKYNTNAFSSVVTALNNAVDTIKTVVANTITQATAVANLHSGKQTMPDSTTTNGTCPNYKQCLLVEDESGTPHWYVITDPFRDFVTPIVANSVNGWDYIGNAGYTQLEYIESDGTQYIDTGIKCASNNVEVSAKIYTTVAGVENDFISNLVSSSPRFVIGTSSGINWFLYSRSGATTPSETNANIIVSNTAQMFEIYGKYDQTTATKTLTVNGQTSSTAYNTIISNNEVNINLLRQASGTATSYMSGKLYYVTYKEDGVMRFNYIPARRNSDNVIGMYDTVSGDFKASSGTGAFTAGNPVANPNPALPTTPTWTVAWAPDSDYAGSVNGTAKCNNSSSDATATTSGSNCWCRVTSILVDGTTTNVDGTWAFRTGSGWTDSCVAECATSCAAGVYNNATFRRTVFGM